MEHENEFHVLKTVSKSSYGYSFNCKMMIVSTYQAKLENMILTKYGSHLFMQKN